MRLPAALLLLPMLAGAQERPSPPPEVDQALRQRATQFLQSQVDGSYRKSFDLVAEDTKDWYFGATKTQLLSFKIESVEYSEDFAKATVKSSTRRNLKAMGQSFMIDLPQIDRWKIEDGKWFWYQDTTMVSTPFGTLPAPSAGPEAAAPTGSAPALPADMSPEAVMAAARKLSAAMSVDKKALTFEAGVPASEEIVFHNGAPGLVKLLVDKSTPMDSITTDIVNTTVKPDQDIRVKVTYSPDASGVKSTTLRLTVEPFDKVYSIPVTVAAKPQ